jgi:hypothetical protein
MDPTPKRRMLKEKTPDVLARSHPNSRARGAKKTLKANWLPQETMRIKKPAITMSQPGENMRRKAFPFSRREYPDIFGNGENLPGFCSGTITQTSNPLNPDSSGIAFLFHYKENYRNLVTV